jgi:hypothetical protein
VRRENECGVVVMFTEQEMEAEGFILKSKHQTMVTDIPK